MPDSIPLPEMDELYNRLEDVVDTERQSEIEEFLRPKYKASFAGKKESADFVKSGRRFKLIYNPAEKLTEKHIRLAKELAMEGKRRRRIAKIKGHSKATLRELKRIQSDGITSDTKEMAEAKIALIVGERNAEYRKFVDRIRNSKTPEEAKLVAEDASKSELLTEKEISTIQRMAEVKFT